MNKKTNKISQKIRLKEGVFFRIIDKEAAVVRPDDGSLIILNETATFIFKNISRGTSKEMLIKKIIKEYDTTEKEAEKDLNSFLKTLEKEDLVEIS